MSPEGRSAEVKRLRALNKQFQLVDALPLYSLSVIEFLTDSELVEAVQATARRLAFVERVLAEQ